MKLDTIKQEARQAGKQASTSNTVHKLEKKRIT